MVQNNDFLGQSTKKDRDTNGLDALYLDLDLKMWMIDPKSIFVEMPLYIRSRRVCNIDKKININPMCFGGECVRVFTIRLLAIFGGGG